MTLNLLTTLLHGADTDLPNSAIDPIGDRLTHELGLWYILLKLYNHFVEF